MKKSGLYIISVLVTFCVLYACEEKDPEDPVLTPKSLELTEESPYVIDRSNGFGIELFKEVAEEETGNFMISPLSASVALTMLLNGCDGSTYDQIKGMLNYPEDLTLNEINETYKTLVSQLLEADNKVTLALANAIFYRDGFIVKEPFLNSMQTGFSAYIRSLDFNSPSALDEINGWASDNTNGKIEEVLQSISADAVMFIMNALYFKGDWAYKFDEALTGDKPFYPDGSGTIMVSTMNGEVGAKIYSTDGYMAVELPYGRTNYTMVIIVPEDNLTDLCSSFDIDEWNSLTDGLGGQDEFGNVEVSMPVFKFSYEKYLNDQLKSMGMTDAFDDFRADLTGISDEHIYVSFVKQNTFIEVNEEGTEAAAVTTIGINLLNAGTPQTPVFNIDKSFLFAIRERTTNTILFIGQVFNPESE